MLGEVLGREGLTSREAHHWIRSGYLGTVEHHGSGRGIDLTDDQVLALTWIKRLVLVGFRPQAAATLVNAHLVGLRDTTVVAALLSDHVILALREPSRPLEP